MSRLIRHLLPAALILTALPALSAKAADVTPEPQTNSTALWLGVGYEESEAWAVHAGGVWAANGDLDASGFMFRGQLLYVDWEFDRHGDDGDGKGRIGRGNASIGYQVAGESIVASLFAGIDYQDVDVDPGSDTDLDSEVGLIVTGRLATKGQTALPMSLEGNYSTANDSYWARARVGYQFSDWVAVGPEFAVLGDDGLDAYRVGGYAALGLTDGIILDLNAGYHDASGSANHQGSDDGLYGGATLVFVF